MNGYGQYIWPDRRFYKGNYLDDKKHGYGEFRWADGKYYKGEWSKG